MKYLNKISLFVFTLLFISINLYSDVIPNKLRIKLKYDTEQYQKWVKNNNIASASEFQLYLGEYEINPFIKKEVLNIVDKKISKQENTQLRAANKKRSGLEAIFEISYNSNMDPILASKKIEKLTFIEYAEPIYTREFFYTPNDTMFTEQYYIFNTEAHLAWDVLKAKNITDTVVIGIVDTGVDIDHPDLTNLHKNIGELGIDSQGNDKSANGIDDDENGYIDDWFGWDFVAGDLGLEEDNMPLPGHSHGTHCAGICAATHDNFGGIAGTAINVKYYPIKIGYDDRNSKSVSNQYKGILYAGISGCDIMNCSWGGGGYSKAEQEIINAVTDMGCLVIAASGNDGSDMEFYPASYDNVYSVAASDAYDGIAYFSNYNYSVDVAAPGRQILSTIANDRYALWSGTSMAAPVAAGIAAMIKLNDPSLSPVEIGETMKATCDNIDTLIYEQYINKIGNGRVNAYKALTTENIRSIDVKNIRVYDNDGDNLFNGGDTLNLTFDVHSILGSVKGLEFYCREESFVKVGLKYIDNLLMIGDIDKGKTVKDVGPIQIVLPKGSFFDYKAEVAIKFSAEDNFRYSTGTTFTLYPTYINMDNNNIKTTINSRGNIAFNDYPENSQGIGFLDKNNNTLLFEGALMIGLDTNMVSDVARGNEQMLGNVDFKFKDLVQSSLKGDTLLAKTIFTDTLGNMINQTVPGFLIDEKVIQINPEDETSPLNNIIFVQYDLINQYDFTSELYAGLYFDWDLGIDATDDQCIYDHENNYGYCFNHEETSVASVGVKLLSDNNLNFYAMDNGGTSDDNIGVYDDFTDVEKFFLLSNGINRDTSNITDVSMVIGAGPMAIQAQDTMRVTFAIFIGDDKEELDNTAIFIDAYRKNLNVNGEYDLNMIESIFPNPVQMGGSIFVKYFIEKESNVNLDIYDLSGRKVLGKFSENLQKGKHFESIDLPILSPGTYYLSIITKNKQEIQKFIVID